MNLRAGAPLLSVAAAFALGAAAARLAVAARPEHAFAADFAQPLVVVTAWGRYGGLCFAILLGTIALAGLALFACLRPYARVPAPRPAAVALAAAAALAAAFTWPFVFSSDVYAYAAYGRLAADGRDPYLAVASGLHGPFLEAARFQWRGSFPPCVYGPAFVAVARGIAVLAGGNVGLALLGLRLTACTAYVACVFPLHAALHALPEPRRSRLVAAFILNPVALWSVAEGHNDALVLLVALAGFSLLCRHALAGAFILGVAPVIKATAVVFSLGLAVEALLFAPRVKRLSAPLALGLTVALAFALPPVLPGLEQLHAAGGRLPTTSTQSLFGLAPVAALAFVAAAYGVLRLRERQRDGFAWLGIGAWLALPSAYPWYCLWLLPGALAAGGGPVAAALYGVTISGVIRYLPDAVGNMEPGELRLAAVLAASPLLLALASVKRPLVLRKTTSGS